VPSDRPAVTRAHRVELAVGLALLGAAIGAAAYWSRVTPAGRADAFPVSRSAAATEALDFELPDLAGRPVRLRDFRGRVVLLNLWATWCAPCREEMPALATLAEELGPRGLAVVGVNHQESKRDVEAFVREQGLRFPVLLDLEGHVGRGYKAFALPVTFVVDRRGMLAGTVLGIREWLGADARAYLGRLLDTPPA
jgi:peroxiredoxin